MMNSFRPYLIAGLGSALGGMSRLWISTLIARRFGEDFPWGTLTVNVTGSFAIGVFVAVSGPDSRWSLDRQFALFFMTGICGGYTTFSAFSLQTFQLLRDGNFLAAGGNVVLSVLLCLLAVFVGYLAGQLVNQA